MVTARSMATVWQGMATDCLPRPGGDLLTTMLRPQDGPTRERKNLNGLWRFPPHPARRRKNRNGLWRFRLAPAGEGRAAGWEREPLAEARDMPVPASYNDIPA